MGDWETVGGECDFVRNLLTIFRRMGERFVLYRAAEIQHIAEQEYYTCWVVIKQY